MLLLQKKSDRATYKKEYHAWAAMKQRCLNPKATGYKYYGGRAICVCPQWIKSFDQFLKDMGPCPKNRSLDRKDPDGHYEPSNCRWATVKQQNNNRTNSINFMSKLFYAGYPKNRVKPLKTA